MRPFYLISLLLISGCSSEVDNSQYKEQIKILVNEDDLVDFQSSSAVAEWTPSTKKEINEIFDDLLPTIKISGEIQEYDPYKSKNLIVLMIMQQLSFHLKRWIHHKTTI
ncbi:hypothetical protein ABHN11_02630 [Brevibacillus centrosporus]|uniref:hypothetical protein n=1 Tax=Brevibacillus centrosporus TaxID=54910 RepID=UPI003D24E79F